MQQHHQSWLLLLPQCITVIAVICCVWHHPPLLFANANDVAELAKDEKMNEKASESSTLLKDELESGSGMKESSSSSSSSSRMSYSSSSSSSSDQSGSLLEGSSSSGGGASAGESGGAASASGKKKKVKKTIVIEESSDEAEEQAKQAKRRQQQEETEEAEATSMKANLAGGGEGVEAGSAKMAAAAVASNMVVGKCGEVVETQNLPGACDVQSQTGIKGQNEQQQHIQDYHYYEKEQKSLAQLLNFLKITNGQIHMKQDAAYADLFAACGDYLPTDACQALKPMCAVSDTARAIRFLRERSDYILYMSSDLQKHIDYVKSTVPLHNVFYANTLLQNLDNIKNLLPSVTKTAPLIRLILDEDSEEELERIVNAHLRFKQECEEQKKLCAEAASKRGVFLADIVGFVDVPTKACQQYNELCCCNGYKFHRYYQSLVREEEHKECREARAMRRATRRLVESACAYTCGSCPTRYRAHEYAADLVRAFDCDKNKTKTTNLLAMVHLPTQVHVEVAPPELNIIHTVSSPTISASSSISTSSSSHHHTSNVLDSNVDMLDLLMGAHAQRVKKQRQMHQLHQLLAQQQAAEHAAALAQSAAETAAVVVDHHLRAATEEELVQEQQQQQPMVVVNHHHYHQVQHVLGGGDEQQQQQEQQQIGIGIAIGKKSGDVEGGGGGISEWDPTQMELLSSGGGIDGLDGDRRRR